MRNEMRLFVSHKLWVSSSPFVIQWQSSCGVCNDVLKRGFTASAVIKLNYEYAEVDT